MARISDNELKGILEIFKQRFAAEIDPTARLALFGSRARGDHLQESDVDLFIISPFFADLSFRERIIRVLELWPRLDIWLEPICLTSEEFDRKRAQLTFIKEAHAQSRSL
ncbi:MAG: nucleotidyltransferase domain-containing protein [Candidatus Heimdallarchaeota archaeon]